MGNLLQKRSTAREQHTQLTHTRDGRWSSHLNGLYTTAITTFLFLTVSFLNGQTVHNVTASYGLGQSPAFPNNYPGNAKQRWIITLPDQTKVISLSITFLDIEGYPRQPCHFDWLQLVDGRNLGLLGPVCAPGNTQVPSIGVYCNYHAPPLRQAILLNTNQLIVEFCSNMMAENKGFYYFWSSAIPPSTPAPVTTPSPPTGTTHHITSCGRPIHVTPNYTVILTSPGYPPGPYPNNLLCTWNVTAQVGTMISILTDHFHLEGNCYDVLIVTMADGKKQRFCGYNGPNYKNASSQVSIQFFTDMTVQKPGFQLTLGTVVPVDPHCNTTFNLVSVNQTVDLFSPGWPNNYPNSINCIWTIANQLYDSDYGITLTFLTFSTERGYDILHVTQANGQQQAFDGNMPANYTFSYNTSQLTVQFTTDSSTTLAGFHILANLTMNPINPLCNTTFNLTSVTQAVDLYSLGWPGNYQNLVNCKWTITNGLYDNSFEIRLTFLAFNTERDYDFVHVTQANGIQETFDGEINPNTTAIYITTNLTVRFTSDSSVTKSGFHILVNLTFGCARDEFKCKTVNLCVPSSKRCDYVQDCPDNSDETSLWCLMRYICGKPVIPPNIHVPGQRIVNGTVARPGSWPWTVSVHTKKDDFQFCDGTLISTRWVISAAHCFYEDTDRPDQYIIKVGSFHDHDDDKPYERDIPIQKIWVHPKFHGAQYGNDIAVVRLAKDVPFGNAGFNNHTGVACLPKPGYTVPAGTNCVITGWGVTHGTGSDLVLRQAVVPIVDSSVCNNTDHYNGQIRHDMICAGYEMGMEDTCQGDSGGPLVCRSDKDNSTWVLQGITSWGRGCAQPHRPGIYSRLSALVDFAYEIVNHFD